MSLWTKDWIKVIFEKTSLYFYERERLKQRKSLKQEKEKFIKQNTIVVTVNDRVVYDSSINGVMSDDLFLALLDYGIKNDAKTQKKKNIRKKPTLTYNLSPNLIAITK